LVPNPTGSIIVTFTLRLAVYRQSVCLGAKDLEAQGQRLFFVTEPLWSSNILSDMSNGSVEVEVKLRPTVSRTVFLGVRRPSGTSDQFFFLLEIFFRQLGVCYFCSALSDERMGL
jgi:hypothetical protein